MSGSTPLALLLVALFSVAMYGWGLLLATVLLGRAPRLVAFTTALGTAFVICVGGWLSLARMVSPAVLDGLLGVGVVGAALPWLRPQSRPVAAAIPSSRIARVVAGSWLAVAALALLAGGALLPAAVVNHIDNLCTYLVRPLRLLQVGTVGDSPFDAAGDGLGGQAFMQAFFLAHLPPAMLPAFEPVFSFALAAGLVIDLGIVTGGGPAARLGALTLFAVIPPLAVNATALYAGTAMILGLFIAVLRLEDAGSRPDERAGARMRAALVLGPLVAAVVGLKSTFVGYVAMTFVLALGALRLGGRDALRAWLRPLGAAAGAAAFGVLPWVLVDPGLLSGASETLVQTPAAQATPYSTWLGEAYRSLVSVGPTFYGGRFLSFTVVALGLWVAAAAVVAARRGGAHAVIAAGLVAAGLALFAGCLIVEVNGALRYAMPAMLAAAPAAVLLLSGPTARGRPIATVALGLLGAAGLSFAPTWAHNLSRMAVDRTYVSYAFGPWACEWTQFNFSDEVRAAVAEAQGRVPQGAAIWTWTSHAIHVNFRSHRVVVANDLGMGSPRVNLPYGGSPEDLRRALRAHGIEYLLVDRPEDERWSDRVVRMMARSPSTYQRHVAANEAAILTGIPGMLRDRRERLIHTNRLMMVIDIRR